MTHAMVLMIHSNPIVLATLITHYSCRYPRRQGAMTPGIAATLMTHHRARVK